MRPLGLIAIVRSKPGWPVKSNSRAPVSTSHATNGEVNSKLVSSRLPSRVNTKPLTDGDGRRPYAAVASFSDITELRTTIEVTLPLARNGILAGLVLAFARALGEFGATLMLAGNIPGRTATVPLSIYTAVQTGEEQAALVLVALLTVLSCAVLVAANRLGARAA